MKLALSRFCAIVLSTFISYLSAWPDFVNVLASEKGINAFSFRPPFDGGKFINTYDAFQNGSSVWRVGAASTFAYRVLSVERSATTSDKLLEKAYLIHLHSSWRLSDHFSIGFEGPFGLHQYRPKNDVGGVSQDRFVVGDILVASKVNFSPWNSKAVSLAVVGHLLLPTGFGAEYAGSGYVSGGGTAVLSYRPVAWWHWAGNIGAHFQQKYRIGNQANGHQFRLNGAMAVDIIPTISLIAEIRTSTELQDMFGSGVQSPTEALFSISNVFEEAHASIYATGAYGISHENGVPIWRAITGWRQNF